MKLPWNKKYLTISFHIIVTLLGFYFLKYFIDFFAFSIKHLDVIFIKTSLFFKYFISIFSVVIIAFIISYLLDPIVEFFQNRYDVLKGKYILKILKNNKKSKKIKTRLEGVIITYFIILLVFVIVTTIIVIKVKNNSVGDNIAEITINYIKNSIATFGSDFTSFYNKIENFLIQNGIFTYISPHISSFINSFTLFIKGIGNSIIDIISSIGNGIINFLLSVVVSFYFLKDKFIIKQKISNFANIFLNKKVNLFLKNSLLDIHEVFSGYIRGTLLDASIMAILISISLSLIKVKFAVIIGVISGFSNIIPYFGALMGFILAISISLISKNPMQAIYSTIIMFILQQIDTIFIAPKVIGENVELSPVLVIIALSVFGQLFGIWGMVFAVPIFATIKLFSLKIYNRQKLKKETKILLEKN